MKTKSVGINAVLNMIRQGLSVLFPLIAYPYTVRTLGVDSLGKVNYVQSLVSYYSLLATLGIPNYMVREGSRLRNSREEFNKFLNEVYSINLVFTGIAYVLLVLGILIIPQFSNYSLLILVQSISIIFTTWGIDWINTIFEDFLKITIRSICTYIITIILLLVFVKGSEDYYIYSLLTVITNGIICIFNRITCRKYVHLRFTLKMRFREHIRPLLVLFVNSVIITLNTSFDVTMLGWMKGDYPVGIYSLAVKVFTVVKSILFAVYVVAIPRLSFYVGNNDYNEYKKLCTRISVYLTMLTMPISMGMLLISRYIVFFLGGEELNDAVFSLRILSITLLFSAFSGIIMNAMNISLRREKENLISTTISAVTNISMNFVFISLFSQNGAAITTLISEVVLLGVSLIRFKGIQKYVDFIEFGREVKNTGIATIFMIVAALSFNLLKFPYIISFLMTISVCGIVYFITLYLMKDTYLIKIIDKVCSKVKTKQ